MNASHRTRQIGVQNARVFESLCVGIQKGIANRDGVKGVGEVPSIGGPGPLMNAVIDAVKGYGVMHIDIPMTPQKVWAAIQNEG